jgi:hypothetical protein
MDESLADLCELDWFKRSRSSTVSLVRSFQIGGDFGELDLFCEEMELIARKGLPS